MAPLFDVIHFHTGFLQFPMSRTLSVPHVTTLHGRLDLPYLLPLFRQFHDVPLVSISNAQRRPVPAAAWQGTVYHGLDPGLLAFSPQAEDYVVFLGRIAPEKRPDRAIDIARAAGVRLKIAAKVDKIDEQYFAEVIEPMLHADGVEFLGEISEEQKGTLLGGARALLFPIDWPEPFGHGRHRKPGGGDARHRVEPRVRARVDRSRPHRVHREFDRRGCRSRTLRHGSRPPAMPRGVRAAIHRRPHGARLRGGLCTELLAPGGHGRRGTSETVSRVSRRLVEDPSQSLRSRRRGRRERSETIGTPRPR
jgi:hypothetical protein